MGLGGAKEGGDAESDQDIDSEDAFFDCEGVDWQSVIYTGEGDRDSELGSEEDRFLRTTSVILMRGSRELS